MDIITIPESNMNENDIKFGIAIQNAILNGECEKCKYLKQCENNKDFNFPDDSWCFNKYKEMMFK